MNDEPIIVAPAELQAKAGTQSTISATTDDTHLPRKIGRASCRERV